MEVDLQFGFATGAAGNDTLISIENAIGSAFDDFAVGNAGDNVLDGVGGNDGLLGQDGDDISTAAPATISCAAATATTR